MSCDWNVHCVTCDDTHHFNDANHMDQDMWNLCRNAAAIAALKPLMDGGGRSGAEIELRLGMHNGRISVDWFAKHAGHTLVPIDEYGALATQCGEWVSCVCGSQRRCGLDKEHEGEHDPKERT